MIDMLIKNGRIFDPGQKIDKIGDIALHRGYIISIGQNLEYEAEKTLNAKGFLVVPGLIDVHTHINWKGNYIGMPADLGCIPNGVTATIDAGSTGVSNYRGLKYTYFASVAKKEGYEQMSALFLKTADNRWKKLWVGIDQRIGSCS